MRTSEILQTAVCYCNILWSHTVDNFDIAMYFEVLQLNYVWYCKLIWILKIYSYCNELWCQQLADCYCNLLYSLTIYSNGNLLYSLTIDSNGNLLYSLTIDSYCSVFWSLTVDSLLLQYTLESYSWQSVIVIYFGILQLTVCYCNILWGLTVDSL